MLGDSVRRRQPRPTYRERAAPRGAQLAAHARIVCRRSRVPFVAGYLIAVYVLFPPSQASGTGGTPVPDLVGRTISDAHRDLVGVGLGDMPTTELPHPEVPEGIIIAQSPLPGQQLRAGSPSASPSAAGRARVHRARRARLQRGARRVAAAPAGFEVRARTSRVRHPRGSVIRTEPEPGSMLTLPAMVVSS
jgi:hypothetical protein